MKRSIKSSPLYFHFRSYQVSEYDDINGTLGYHKKIGHFVELFIFFFKPVPWVTKKWEIIIGDFSTLNNAQYAPPPQDRSLQVGRPYIPQHGEEKRPQFERGIGPTES